MKKPKKQTKRKSLSQILQDEDKKPKKQKRRSLSQILQDQEEKSINIVDSNDKEDKEDNDDEDDNNNNTGGDEDSNNNNNNADEQGEDPDFLYQPNHSAYCIFFQNPTSYSMLRWRKHPYHYPSFPTDIDITILSSCLGILLCHTHSPATSTSTYFIGNPFANLPYMRIHPRIPHYSDTQAVIAGDREGSFLIISILPNPTQEGNMYYAIEYYSSKQRNWVTLSDRTNLFNQVGRLVIPNSGISCRRYGYWLTLASEESRNKGLLVRVDPKSSVDPAAYKLLTYAIIPVEYGDAVAGMRLGRVGNKVGLVIVNKTKSRVELHMLIEKGSENGNENDVDAKMIGWTRIREVLNVDLDPTMDEAEVKIVEPHRIRCREMPKPINFESYKTEVLLLVGRRMVLWENCQTNIHKKVVMVIPGEVQANGRQYLAINGVTHVASSIVPRLQDDE